MRIRTLLALAAAAAVLVPTTGTATADPFDGEIDISGAELAGSLGVAAVNVYGTVRCAEAGPLSLDVTFTQPSTGGVGAGGNNGMTCPAAGDFVRWAITAEAVDMFVGDKLEITAVSGGSTIATDTEDHELRWGR
jgi:hypothetical protein